MLNDLSQSRLNRGLTKLRILERCFHISKRLFKERSLSLKSLPKKLHLFVYARVYESLIVVRSVLRSVIVWLRVELRLRETTIGVGRLLLRIHWHQVLQVQLLFLFAFTP